MEAHRIRIPVPGTPAGAASARRQIAEEIPDWGAALGPVLLDAAVLVASELITNAVRHADKGPITAGAYLSDEALRIAVIDTNFDIPEVGLPDAEEEDGRGLFLVAALADRHGFDPLPSGKRCWAELDLSAPLPTVATHVPKMRS
ncbi:ATP-binding protein [Streptomyces sp. NBC_00304]|uniref:ATP-binding protein n=1 Tax=Streptomyces sp. NBC_00304 TaxID=2975706 RepID=UPI002E2ABE43|nr:ATP-binding protein [Streptomyces sp. NBC_00304]